MDALREGTLARGSRWARAEVRGGQCGNTGG